MQSQLNLQETSTPSAYTGPVEQDTGQNNTPRVVAVMAALAKNESKNMTPEQISDANFMESQYNTRLQTINIDPNSGSPPQILNAQVLSSNPGQLNDSIPRLSMRFLTSKQNIINITSKVILSGSLAYTFPVLNVGLGCLISGAVIGGSLLLGTLIASRSIKSKANRGDEPEGPKCTVGINAINICCIPYSSFMLQVICNSNSVELDAIIFGFLMFSALLSESTVISNELLRQNEKIQRVVAQEVPEIQDASPETNRSEQANP